MTDGADIGLTLSIVGSVLGASGTVIAFLARAAFASKESELRKEIAGAHAVAVEAKSEAKATAQEFRIDAKVMNERLHADEKKTIEQGGAIERLGDKHDRLDDDLREIKETMATKSDVQQIDRTLRDLSAALLGRQGYTPRMTPGPGRYGQSGTESPPPPKNK